ncbi:MAG: replication initiation protein [Psychrobacter nivimaris]
MECIKRVDPQKWEEVPLLVELYQNLPTTLRCSTIKNSTLFRKKTDRASAYAYVGYNPPNITRYIVLDLDYDNALFAYYDHNAPLPQFIIKNPDNGHCHYVYQLKDPVTFYGKSKSAPIRLLTATEQALTALLNADRGFTGYLAKNALNRNHETYITGTKPYTLTELSQQLDLEHIETPNEPMNDHTYGRNSSTFDAVRVQAYKVSGKLSYTQLYNECLALAESHNAQYEKPMSYNEIKGIAKSIAGYCKSQAYIRSLSEVQAVRGAKGGKISKRKPVATSKRTTQPWLELGISRATYYRDINDNNSQK